MTSVLKSKTLVYIILFGKVKPFKKKNGITMPLKFPFSYTFRLYSVECTCLLPVLNKVQYIHFFLVFIVVPKHCNHVESEWPHTFFCIVFLWK